MTEPPLMDDPELRDLEAEHGTAMRAHVDLDLGEREFTFWRSKIVPRGKRRGEVLLLVRRPDGRILLHTKAFYPADGWRLLSGGIRSRELAAAAAARELREETGQVAGTSRYMGLQTYAFRFGADQLGFRSYLFAVEIGDGVIRPEDDDEAISGFRWVVPVELRTVAARLRAIESEWRDWGRFRAIGHELAADLLDVPSLAQEG